MDKERLTTLKYLSVTLINLNTTTINSKYTNTDNFISYTYTQDGILIKID
ncbi:hypothetical protein [Campylobacter ureolyticus]|nr:hypothetical protein [Campylobacter ureolyticus]MDK8323165.1 hypothetical protein [Campylobacter ureolyticus]QIX86607.1 hypothetical protein FOB81_04660 [Campylobacter ureolyticus]STA71101.1 Uncharacterised protein [Campylobacter ureolyticus]